MVRFGSQRDLLGQEIVDFDERVDVKRLKKERLARLQGEMAKADLGGHTHLRPRQHPLRHGSPPRRRLRHAHLRPVRRRPPGRRPLALRVHGRRLLGPGAGHSVRLLPHGPVRRGSRTQVGRPHRLPAQGDGDTGGSAWASTESTSTPWSPCAATRSRWPTPEFPSRRPAPSRPRTRSPSSARPAPSPTSRYAQSATPSSPGSRSRNCSPL